MIRHLREEDTEAYLELRRRSLTESPLCFSASPEDDFVRSVNGVIGAFDPDLVGAVGILRDRHLKAAHKAHVWGMYVMPSHRRRGIATQLLDAAIVHARTLSGVEWIVLSVTDAAPAARRLYERAGFTVWGREEDALRHEGRSVADYRMALKL